MFTRITLAALIALAALATLTVIPAAAQFDGDRITGVVWTDSNCDGIRQAEDTPLPHVRLTLRWAGSNGVIDGTDRDIDQSESLTGTYRFFAAGAGDSYFLSIRSEDKPTKMTPAPFRQGSDATIDNDMTVGLLPGTTLWATPVFTMPADGSMVTGLDIGLCALTPSAYLPGVSR